MKKAGSRCVIKEKEKERKKMAGACTIRPRNHDDPQLSPDESFPLSRTQTRRDKTQSVGHGQDENEGEDEDDETSTDPSSSDSSSVDSSSEEEEEDDDEQEQEQEQKQEENSAIQSLQPRQKPRIHRVEKNNDILSRITAFLPQMKTANEDLERELAAGRGNEVQLDDADEQGDGRYIEMV